MSDDRSERLRRRRKQSRPDGPSARSAAPTAGNGTGTGSDSAATGDGEVERDGSESGDVSIKDEGVGTYMYLPENQRRELRRRYNVLKAEYEFEYGDGFEKNRHFYPLVIQFGLEGLDGLDASEIRARLDDIG